MTIFFSFVFDFLSPFLCDADDILLADDMHIIWICSLSGLWWNNIVPTLEPVFKLSFLFIFCSDNELQTYNNRAIDQRRQYCL